MTQEQLKKAQEIIMEIDLLNKAFMNITDLDRSTIDITIVLKSNGTNTFIGDKHSYTNNLKIPKSINKYLIENLWSEIDFLSSIITNRIKELENEFNCL